MECQHNHVDSRSVQQATCRYVPSWMERYSDDDPYETVVVTDVIYFCADCGEELDVVYGD